MSEVANVINVLKLKCPRCHNAPLFKNKNVYQFKGFFDMYDNCSCCNQDFQIETGFYYGATYSSYAITVLLNASVFGISYLLFGYDMLKFLIMDLIVLIAAMPYVFKLSRAIWLALMVKPDSEAIKKYEHQA